MLQDIIVISVDFICFYGLQVLKLLNKCLVIFEVLVNVEALMIVEGPMTRILNDCQLLPNFIKLLVVSNNFMFGWNSFSNCDILQVLHQTRDLVYNWTAILIDILHFAVQRNPLLTFFVATLRVLFCRMKMILEVIHAVLAISLPIVRAILASTLVILCESSAAAAIGHPYNLTLISLHNDY